MKRLFFAACLLFGTYFSLAAQIELPPAMRDTLRDGAILELIVTEDGDTIPMILMPEIPYISRRFDSDNDRRAFEKLTTRIMKVYPYARKAADIQLEIDEIKSSDLRRRKQKKRLKKLEDQLSEQFKEDLMNLTRSEGKILVDIIERQTGRTMYTIIKEQKNRFSAFFYQQVGKRFGYDLKDGYDPIAKSDLELIVKNIEESLEYAKSFDLY